MRALQVPDGYWDHPRMRQALLTRDVAGIYHLLQRVGISQRRIAAWTEQSQSEISEILAGRQVNSYDVLSRIQQGLGIPAGRMGMQYDLETLVILGPSHPQWQHVPEPLRLRPEVSAIEAVIYGTEGPYWD